MTLDVTQALRAGDNSLAITGTNSSGPPALWMEFAADGIRAALGRNLGGQLRRFCLAAGVAGPAARSGRPGQFACRRGDCFAIAPALLVVLAMLCAGIVLLAGRKGLFLRDRAWISYTLEEFLECFASVTREMACRVL